MFESKGQIIIESEDLDEDKVMEDALEVGASDFQADEDVFEIYTEPSDFSGVRDDLMAKGYTFVSADVAQIPSTYTAIPDAESITKMGRLLEMLEDNDDEMCIRDSNLVDGIIALFGQSVVHSGQDFLHFRLTVASD